MPAHAGYQQIKTQVLMRIRDDIWPPGSFLPTEVDLADMFGCARATVNRALRELAEEGVLDRRRKAGTRVRLSPLRKAEFVIPLIREEIEASGSTYGYVLVSRDVTPAPGWLAAAFGIPLGAEVLHLRCLHLCDEDPFQVEERWINLDTVPSARSADFRAMGPNEWLVREVPFTDVEVSFGAVAASEEVAALLAVTKGAAVFEVERKTWLEGQAVTLARMWFRPGYRMTTGQ